MTNILTGLISRTHRWVRPVDHLVLEMCPLHTEKPEWAAKAPAQITAAFLRGADVIGFTEVSHGLPAELKAIAKEHGYRVLHGLGDTAVAYKASLSVTQAESAHDAGLRAHCYVTFIWHNRTVTVYVFHWATGKPGHQGTRDAQTRILIEEMGKASRRANLGFYMADSNPSGDGLRGHGEPQDSLRAAGLPLIYDEVGFPHEPVGVTTIGRNSKDTAVKGVRVTMHNPLGSDHKPATAVYAVKRRRFRAA